MIRPILGSKPSITKSILNQTIKKRSLFIPSAIKSYDEKIPVASLLCDEQVQDNDALHYIKVNDKAAISTSSKVPLIRTEFKVSDMRDFSTKFATFLRNLGIKKQDRVAVMLPKCPELMISALGIWRCGATYVPLFTAFGPEAIIHRVKDSGAKFIITDDVNRAKLDQLPEIIDDSSIKIITVNSNRSDKRDYDFWLDGIKSNVTADNTVDLFDPNDCMILLYTSGTTGKSKGVIVHARCLNAIETYMKLGFHIEDKATQPLRFWNIADCGWAYGMYYALIGPLLTGTTTRFVNAPFKPATVYSVLESESVNNFAAAPTAYRTMMAEGEQLIKQFNFYVQRVSSAGEPLNPEAIRFFQKYWGTRVLDHYGQTESGMTVCQLHHPDYASTSNLTSMGKPMPGFDLKILDEKLEEITQPRVPGLLAIDVGNSPHNFFGGYWNSEQKTKERIVTTPANKVYELTGDVAFKDEEGNFYFGGRADDVITSSGFRVGPKEIEDALIEHPAVKESGVVGRPDELRGEAIVAFVVLRNGYTPSEKLAEELKNHVKNNLSRHLAPKDILFVTELPYTEAGKIRRNVLRQRLLEQK